MAQVDTVVPNSLNYTDIKPQAIENKIQLSRYQPTATVTGAKGGDLVKFLISGNGFLDPYSTYFQFKVTIPDLAVNELRFVDRSAHSFFSRIVIRSQGVEIERLENYDVMCAMVNDMLYSPEQCTQHYWEGFPTHTYQLNQEDGAGGGINVKLKNKDNGLEYSGLFPCVPIRDECLKWLCQGSSPSQFSYVGETCFHNVAAVTNTHKIGEAANQPVDWAFLPDTTMYVELAGGNAWNANRDIALAGGISFNPATIGLSTDPNNVLYPTTFAYHDKGIRQTTSLSVADSAAMAIKGTREMIFTVPIYSGLIGLLMPEKKLLPLNLLPLDIEVVFNPHALYSSRSNATNGKRNYTVSDFYLYGNTLFFEQEIHRTLEASVADHGLFIYCNSFHHAPLQLLATQAIPTNLQISMNLKSINSVHWVFMYTHYETSPCARKLHFVSHNIWKMQLLNGTQLIPQYPIEGHCGSSGKGEQLGFVIELYKAWNKMHDPARDGALHAYNTCGDQYAGQFDPLYSKLPEPTSLPEEGFNIENQGATKFTALQLANKQANVGRAQYGISLEGEELGSDKTMITGRKSQYPFSLLLWSTGKFSSHASYMITFLRADFIVYIRPDLQIVTLGK